MNPSNTLPEAFLCRAAARLSIKDSATRFGYKVSDIKRWENGVPCPPEYLEELKGLRSYDKPATPGAFTFIDLFAGIGGMRRAFEAANGRCVMTSEWNRHALETYIANHGAEHPICGDITKVDAADVPDHDVLVAGFPCQPFSLAGVSAKNFLNRPHGFADETQGTLFFDVARIIAEKRPRAFLLENVRNLAAHDKGRTMDVIMRTLRDELGYKVTWKVMNSAGWVPQKRLRIAIVGLRDGTGFDGGEAFDFDHVVEPNPDHGPTMSAILHRKGEIGSEDCPYAPGGVPLAKYTLTDSLWSYLQNYAAKHASKGNGFGYGLVGPDDVARTLSARYGKDGSEILVAQNGQNPRRLTPRECARLMGFDRDGQRMIIPVSDTQAYRQFGNSVVVPCFEAIAHAIAAYLPKAQIAEAA